MNKLSVLFGAAGLAAACSGVTVQWDFPRLGSCHEGLPFADGRTGVLVWGGGDTVNLTVGRGDLWDHRGGYPWTSEQSYTNIVALARAKDAQALKTLFSRPVPPNWNPDGSVWTDRYNPYLLPLGRIVVKLPGVTLARGELDTSTGLGRLILADGRAIELAMSKSSHAFALKPPKGVEAIASVKPSTDFPIYEQKLKWRGFEKAKLASNGFTWNLPADKPVWLSCDKTDGALIVKTGRGEEVESKKEKGKSNDESKEKGKSNDESKEKGKSAEGEIVTYERVAAESRAYWQKFWREGARVKVPDAAVQEVFEFGMYKFGAMTDPDAIPAGLQGQWLEDDQLVPWNGDYHFNINIQECYSPSFRGGHFQNLMPLFRMVLSWRERLRDNARKFAGIDDGYVLPHSVDDRGVCIGGFWAGTIDHASTAWVAALMMRYVRYSGDVAFLRESAYDFMKGAMNVYLAMMEEYEGRLSLPLGPSPEWGDSDVDRAVGRDPSFQLAAAHRLARDLIAAATLLNDAPDPRWLDVERRLPPYTAGKTGVELFAGQALEESHRHHSHLAGFYPFDTIAMVDAENPKLVHRTYYTWVRQGTGTWTGWCVPWASILHTHFGSPEAAVSMLQAWKTYFNNPGHGSTHDGYREGFTTFAGRKKIMQMDGQCAAATAVMELMAHDVNGKVEFFRGCPESWKDVSFENLALSDGTRVNGWRMNGQVSVQVLPR